MSSAAIKHLPLEPLVRDTLTPSFWDSPAVALSLRRASLGLPSHPHFDISNSDFIRRTNMQDNSFFCSCTVKNGVRKEFGVSAVSPNSLPAPVLMRPQHFPLQPRRSSENLHPKEASGAEISLQ